MYFDRMLHLINKDWYMVTNHDDDDDYDFLMFIQHNII